VRVRASEASLKILYTRYKKSERVLIALALCTRSDFL
jgi:hypothetical protein